MQQTKKKLQTKKMPTKKSEKRCQAKTTKKEEEPAPMAQFSSTPLANALPRRTNPGNNMNSNVFQ